MPKEEWITKIMTTPTIWITAKLGSLVDKVAATDLTSGAPAVASPSTPGMEFGRQMNKLGGLGVSRNKLRGRGDTAGDAQRGNYISGLFKFWPTFLLGFSGKRPENIEIQALKEYGRRFPGAKNCPFLQKLAIFVIHWL